MLLRVMLSLFQRRCLVTHCNWLPMAMLLPGMGAGALALLLLQGSYFSMGFLPSIESLEALGL